MLVKVTRPRTKLHHDVLHEFDVSNATSDRGPFGMETRLEYFIRGFVSSQRRLWRVYLVEPDFDGRDHFINVRLVHRSTDDQADIMVNDLVDYLSSACYDVVKA